METNRLIAEFMGRSGKLCDTLYTFKGVSDLLEDDIWYTIEQSKFHTSWDWLIPVIHKILHDNNDSSFFKFSMSVSNAIFNNNIDNAHNAVVEFIKIYNDVRLAEEQEHYDNQNN